MNECCMVGCVWMRRVKKRAVAMWNRAGCCTLPKRKDAHTSNRRRRHTRRVVSHHTRRKKSDGGPTKTRVLFCSVQCSVFWLVRVFCSGSSAPCPLAPGLFFLETVPWGLLLICMPLTAAQQHGVTKTTTQYSGTGTLPLPPCGSPWTWRRLPRPPRHLNPAKCSSPLRPLCRTRRSSRDKRSPARPRAKRTPNRWQAIHR